MNHTDPSGESRVLKAFVTGATRGIGRAIATRLAPRCNAMILVARDEAALSETSRELRELGCDKVEAWPIDLAKPTDVASLAERLSDFQGPIDATILNAGTFFEGSLGDSVSSDFRETLEVNLVANYELVKVLLPRLRLSAFPRVIIVGSTAGAETYPLGPLYSVSKWGLRGYAFNLRRELMTSGIGVTYIAPGATLTDLWEGEDLPPGRLLEADDIARVVACVLDLSTQAVVEEIVVRPMLGDIHE